MRAVLHGVLRLQESCDMPSTVSLVQLFSGKFLADA